MTQHWGPTSWTGPRQRLARAVYDATKKESAYAPMVRPLSIGNYLLRVFDRKYLKMLSPDKIDPSTALNSIRITDAAKDRNRFSGSIPSFIGKPPIQPRRGGLYCSEDVKALMAEIYHYSDQNLSRALFGTQERYSVFYPKCFAMLHVLRDINVVNLDSRSDATLPFLGKLQGDRTVATALKESGYKDLFAAVSDAHDYSAARGLGLGLESNPEIQGVQVISARDYLTPVSGDLVFQTGDNVVLFAADQTVAVDMLRVVSLNVVDRNSKTGALTITKFESGATGVLEKKQTISVPV